MINTRFISTIELRPFLKRVSVSALAMALVSTLAVAADKPRDVLWEDLAGGSKNTDGLSADATEENSSSDAFQINASSDGTVPELNGKLVKIPAFIVPLEGDVKALNELLLVPYFGACIHVPPPPPNQIIHVKAEGKGVAVEDLDLYDPVFAIGVLRTESIDHSLARIGYKMDVQRLEPYTE